MSETLDSKVVEMRFDNDRFEENVQTSMNSLEKLKQSLRFDNVSKGFESIERAARDTDISYLSSAAETVGNKFDAMQIAAIAAIHNIVNSAMNAGEKLIKSLSVDNISAGWQKFAEETTSVGTLVAQGYKVDTVTDQLKKLNWYTDETSYNFTSMVSNISKFTATGKNLEDSVTAMEGIANWAALSGQNASVASRAMYQLSQAMGAGTMRLIDWKSIQNMSMDTDEFRQKALDAGIALGTLKKNADGTYSSLVATSKAGKVAFSKSQFAENLTQGKWFTSDVMMKVYKDYSAAVDDIYEYAAEKGITASQAIEELGGKVDEFGLKAFRAAQEARTWSDTVNAVKDAVSTGWMNTFENIFGNYEEAKELWTDLANELYDIFAEGGNERNELLSSWKELGGRDDLLEAFWNSFYALTDIIGVVKESFHDIFPKVTVQSLIRFTKELIGFTNTLRLGSNETKTISTILKALFSILDIGVKTVSSIVSGGFLPLIDAFDRFLNDTDNGIVKLSEFIISVHDTVTEMGLFEDITLRVASVVGILIGYFRRLVSNNIRDFFKGYSKDGSVLSGILYAVAGNLGNLIRMIFDLASAITGIDLSGVRNTVLEKFVNVISVIEDIVSSIDVSSFREIGSGIKTFFTGIGDSLKNLGSSDSGAGTFIQNLRSYFSGMGETFSSPDFETLWSFIKTGGLAYIAYQLKGFVDSISSIGTGLLFGGDLQESITNALDMFGQVRVNTLKNIAVSIGIIAASIVALSMLDTEKLATAVVGIGGAIAGMLAILNKMMNVSAIDDLGTYSALSFLLLSLSGAIMTLSVAMKIIGGMDTLDIVEGLGAMAVMLKGFILAVDKLSIMVVPSEILKAAAAFTVMAFAMNLLIPPMLVFGNMPYEGILKAILALGSFAGLLALITKELSANMAGAGSFAVMAASLNLLIPPMLVFGNMPYEGILKAILALGSFAGLLALITKELGANIMGAATFAVMAASLNLLIAPLTVFAMLPLDTMGIALIEIAGFIGVLTVLINAMNTGIAGAGTFAIMAASLNLLIAPLAAFALLPLDTMGIALIEIAGFIGALAVLTNFMSTGVAGAGALLMVSAAMSMFIPTFALLGKMDTDQIERALLSVGAAIMSVIAAFIAFSAVGNIVAPSIPAILGFGAAILALSIGLNLLTAVDIAAGLMKAISALDEALPAIVDLLLDTLMAILRGIKLYGAEIVELIVDIVDDIILALGRKVGDFVQALVEFLILATDGLADSLVDPENAARMRDAIDHFVFNMIDAIKEFLGINSPSTVFDWIGRMCVEGFTGGFTASFMGDLNRYRELGKQTISEWVSGFKSNYEAGWTAINEFFDGVKTKLHGFFESGKDIADGLSEGLEMFSDDPVSFMKGYGQYLIDTFNKSAGVASPSKKMIESGKYIIGGLTEGIDNSSSDAVDSMKRLGQDAIDAFNDKMGIHSNSDEMIDSGEYTVGGAVEGVENKKSTFEKAMELLGLDGLTNFKNSINYDNGYDSAFSFMTGLNDGQKDASRAKSLFATDKNSYMEQAEEYRRQIESLDKQIEQFTATTAATTKESARLNWLYKQLDIVIKQFGSNSVQAQKITAEINQIMATTKNAYDPMGQGVILLQSLLQKREQLRKQLETFLNDPISPEEEEEVKEKIENTLTQDGQDAGAEAGKKTSQAFWANFKLPDGSIFRYKFNSWDAYTEAGQSIGGFDNVAKAAFEHYNDEDKRSAFQSWDDDALEAQLDSAKEAYDKFFSEFEKGTISASEYERRFTNLLKNNVPVQKALAEYAAEKMSGYTKDALKDATDEYEKTLADITDKMDNFKENIGISWGDMFDFIDLKDFSKNLLGNFSDFFTLIDFEEHTKKIAGSMEDLFGAASDISGYVQNVLVSADDLFANVVDLEDYVENIGGEVSDLFSELTDGVKDYAEGLHASLESVVSSVIDEQNEILDATRDFVDNMHLSMSDAISAGIESEEKMSDNVSSFASSMRKSMSDAFKFKTNAEYIEELNDKLEKTKELYGEDSNQVKVLERQIKNFTQNTKGKENEIYSVNATEVGEKKKPFGDSIIKETEMLNNYAKTIEKLKKRGISKEIMQMLSGMSREEGMAAAEYLANLDEETYRKFLEDWDAHKLASDNLGNTLFEGSQDTIADILEEDKIAIDTYNDELETLLGNSKREVSSAMLDMLKGMGRDEASKAMAYLNGLSDEEYNDFLRTLEENEMYSVKIANKLYKAEAAALEDALRADSSALDEYNEEFNALLAKGVSASVLDMIKGMSREEATQTMAYLNGLSKKEYAAFNKLAKTNEKDAKEAAKKMYAAEAETIPERLADTAQEIADYETELDKLLSRGISSGVLDTIKGMSREEATAAMSYLNSMSNKQYADFEKLVKKNKNKTESMAQKMYAADASVISEKLGDTVKSINSYNKELDTLLTKNVSAGVIDMLNGMSRDEATAVMSVLNNMTSEQYADFEKIIKMNKKSSEAMARKMYAAEASTMPERLGNTANIIGEYNKQLDILLTKNVSAGVLDMLKNMSREEATAAMSVLNNMSAEQLAGFNSLVLKNEQAAKKATTKMYEADAKTLRDRLTKESAELSEYNKELSKLVKRGLDAQVLDTIAGMSREEGLATIKYLNNLSDEEYAELMKTWASNKKKADAAAQTAYNASSGAAAVARFKTDLGENFKMLKNYQKALDGLINKGREMPDSLKEYIASLDTTEGLALIQFLGNLTDEEWENIVKKWKNKEKTEQDIAETLYGSELKDATTEYVNKTSNILNKLPESARETGKKTMKQVAEGMSEESESALESIDVTITSLTDRIIQHFDKLIDTVDAKTSKLHKKFGGGLSKENKDSILNFASNGAKAGNSVSKSTKNGIMDSGTKTANAVHLSANGRKTIAQAALQSVDGSSRGTNAVVNVRSQKVTWSESKHTWVAANSSTASSVSKDIADKINSKTSGSAESWEPFMNAVNNNSAILAQNATAIELMSKNMTDGFNSLGESFSSAEVVIDPAAATKKLAPYMNNTIGGFVIRKMRGI